MRTAEPKFESQILFDPYLFLIWVKPRLWVKQTYGPQVLDEKDQLVRKIWAGLKQKK